MKALIITAHGSRKKEFNLEVESLVEKIREMAEERFEFVEKAFLRFREPFLETKIDSLVKKGVKKIIIFPFFTGSGTHVLVDIPCFIEKAGQKHKNVEFRLTRYLGQLDAVKDIILDEVISADIL